MLFYIIGPECQLNNFMIFAQCHIAKISFIGSNISFSFWRIYFYKLKLNIWNIWKCCKWNVWMFLIKLEVAEMAQLKMKKKLEIVTLLSSSKLYQAKFLNIFSKYLFKFIPRQIPILIQVKFSECNLHPIQLLSVIWVFFTSVILFWGETTE